MATLVKVISAVPIQNVPVQNRPIAWAGILLLAAYSRNASHMTLHLDTAQISKKKQTDTVDDEHRN